jgi:hypothetical protein
MYILCGGAASRLVWSNLNGVRRRGGMSEEYNFCVAIEVSQRTKMKVGKELNDGQAEFIVHFVTAET